MSKISYARASIDHCNNMLESMGVTRRLFISTTRDGGRGSRRLTWNGTREISRRHTDAEIEEIASVLSDVLYELEVRNEHRA